MVPLETALTKGILKIYGVELSGDLATSIVGSAAITNIAKATLSSLKTVPNVAASVLNAVVVFITEKLTDNAVLGFVVKYLENNADKLKGKSAKDIF